MIKNTWLADIPQEWGITPLGSLFTQRKEKNKLLDRTFALSVMKNRGVIPYTEKGNVWSKVSEDRYFAKLFDSTSGRCIITDTGQELHQQATRST